MSDPFMGTSEGKKSDSGENLHLYSHFSIYNEHELAERRKKQIKHEERLAKISGKK